MASRKKNTLKNILVAFFSNILTSILSLFTSKIVKEKLGLDILGLNGVFGNVITILNLTELGIGSAITFSLYEPLANKNVELVKSIMAFYKKAYRIVALVVAVIGMLLFPFIPVLIKSGTFSKSYIYVVYILFLVNTVFSYLFVYKRTLIIADQKNYVISTATLFYTYALKIFQLAAVWFTSNYIFFLMVQIVCTIGYNISVSLICNKLYPYIKEKAQKLPETYFKLITSKIKALFCHSIGTVIVLGTDNILVSYFCGITDAGRYTSYLSIINMIGTMISIIFDNLRDSLGNFLVTETIKRKKELFNNIFFINQTIVSVCSVCLAVLLTPFIRLWFGDDTVLPVSVVLSMVLCFFIQKSTLTIGNIKNAAGLFEQDKFVPLIESVINLFTSIILAKYFGLIGIVLGTIISTVLCPFFIQPLIVFKNIFSESPFFYFRKYALFLLKTLGICAVLYFVIYKINFKPNTLFSFFGETVVIFAISCTIWVLTNFWKSEFKFFFYMIKNKIGKNK